MDGSKVLERMREDRRMVLAELQMLEAAAAGPSSRRTAADWPGGAVLAALATVTLQLVTHMAAEDEVLYPALMGANPALKSGIKPLGAEHGALRKILSRIEEDLRQSPGTSRNERIAAHLRDFCVLLQRHIRKEEVVVFGAVPRRGLPETAMEALEAFNYNNPMLRNIKFTRLSDRTSRL